MIRSYEEILGSTYQVWCPIWDLWSTNSIRIIFWVSWRHNTLYDVIIAYKKIAKIYQIINIFTMMFVYHYVIILFHPQYLPRHAPLILLSGGCQSGGCRWLRIPIFSLLMCIRLQPLSSTTWCKMLLKNLNQRTWQTRSTFQCGAKRMRIYFLNFNIGRLHWIICYSSELFALAISVYISMLKKRYYYGYLYLTSITTPDSLHSWHGNPSWDEPHSFWGI